MSFFDFVELSFKLELTSRTMGDENQIVDTINEIFRVENELYKLTHLVRIEEKRGHHTFVRTSAYPKIIHVEDEARYSEAIAPELSALSAPHSKLQMRNFKMLWKNIAKVTTEIA